MAFERDRPVPLLQMLGGWEPSRAVNQSDGLDPVSLGMAPPIASASTNTPALPAPPTMIDFGVAMNAPTPPSASQPVAPPATSEHADHAPMPGAYVNLDQHYAMLGGRRIRLNGEAEQAIISALIVAMEAQVKDEVATLKMEFGLANFKYQTDSRTAANAIPQTDGPTVGEMQPVPEATSTKVTQLPAVRRRQKRSTTTAPHAQPGPSLDVDGAAPRPDAGV